MKTFKQNLLNNQFTLGSWITLYHPSIVELMAPAGFEWLVVDIEHSVISLEQAQILILAIERSGPTSLVRVGSNDSVEIKKVMDAGAGGVIVPMVNSAEEAVRAVKAVKYAPQGYRGVGLARAQRWGMKWDEHLKWLKEEAVVIVMVEHIEGVRNLPQILEVEGVDGILVGPYDLSGSLGVPGQFDHPEFLKALSEIKTRCQAKKKALGIHVIEPEFQKVIEKKQEGFSFVAFSMDHRFLSRKCQEQMEALNLKKAVKE